MPLISAAALDDGAYTCKVTPHYRHPVTGKIEDSGGEGSEVLGQSMTEGATLSQGLIEQQEGTTYATVRLALMDNIENVEFMVQERGAEDFSQVEYDIMQEDLDANVSDFRFEVPDEDCVVRAQFYVIPMGRTVIYYIDFSQLEGGCGDFVTELEPGTTPGSQDTEVTGEESYEIPRSVENTALGAAFFDEKGQQIYPLADKKETAKMEKKEERSIVLPIAIACSVCVIACVGGIVFYRKRRA
ncbi:MAG: hypothetical protein IJ129_06225 [Ruminococcus sp.]|nr:hypothetical protein [Ruminococcus sp.]